MVKPLIEYMKEVPDPRCSRKKKHVLAEVLICLVVGYLAGKTTLRRSLRWCVKELEWLKSFGILKNGVASVPTASRLLSEIDELLFATAFMEWIGAILSTKGIHIAIDGKALRASLSKVRDTRATMIMNALDTATGLVLAQLPIREKSCELTSIPELLDFLEIEDAVITIDAAGTHTGIMEKILSKGGDFVLFVKKNQPEALEDIQEYFNRTGLEIREGQPKPDGYTVKKRHERNRDRHEYRRCEASTDCGQVRRCREDWAFLRTIGRIQQVRVPIERDAAGNDLTPDKETFLKRGSRRSPAPTSGDSMDDDFQEVGLVSSRELGADELMAIKRAHWSIENQLHHTLDESFREDRSPAKKSRNNLALVRKFVYNILRIAMIDHACSSIMTEAMDDFCGSHELIEKYVFNGIASFY